MKFSKVPHSRGLQKLSKTVHVRILQPRLRPNILTTLIFPNWGFSFGNGLEGGMLESGAHRRWNFLRYLIWKSVKNWAIQCMLEVYSLAWSQNFWPHSNFKIGAFHSENFLEGGMLESGAHRRWNFERCLIRESVKNWARWRTLEFYCLATGQNFWLDSNSQIGAFHSENGLEGEMLENGSHRTEILYGTSFERASKTE